MLDVFYNDVVMWSLIRAVEAHRPVTRVTLPNGYVVDARGHRRVHPKPELGERG
jgi:hypothetical protein